MLQGFFSEGAPRTGQLWSFHLPLPAQGLSVAPLRRQGYSSGQTLLLTEEQIKGLKANLPNTCWLLSMAVRRVCSKMASRSNVRAFLPGRKKSHLSQSRTQTAHFIIKQSKLLYIPNPENPITDAISASPLISSDTRKEASIIYLLKYHTATLNFL